MEVDEQLSAISDNEIEEETSPKKQGKFLISRIILQKIYSKITME